MHLDPTAFRHTRYTPVDNRTLAGQQPRLDITLADLGTLSQRLPIILPLDNDRLPQVLITPMATDHPFGGHTPSVCQHYPFSLLEQHNVLDADGELHTALSLQVDEKAPHLFEGMTPLLPGEQRLFDAQGQPTPFLREVIQGLLQQREQIAQTLAFLARLDEIGLLIRAKVQHGRELIACRLIDGSRLQRLESLPDSEQLQTAARVAALQRAQDHLQPQGQGYTTGFEGSPQHTASGTPGSLRLQKSRL